MALCPIIYFGPPGLECDVLKSYLNRSGYPVFTVSRGEALESTLHDHPDAIAVISASGPPRELSNFAHRLLEGRAAQRSGAPARAVLILYDGPRFDPGAEGAYVITQPQRISQAVQRVLMLTRESAGSPI